VLRNDWLGSRRKVVLFALLSCLACIFGSWDAQAQDDDPFGEETGKAVAGAGKDLASEAAKAGLNCPPLSEKICKEANKSLFFVCAGYLVVCLFLALLLNSFWAKRESGSPLIPFLVPLVLFAIINGVLVGVDPLGSTNLGCCLADGVFRVTLFLGDSAVARALVLGALPFGILYAIIVVIVRFIQNR